MSKRNRLKKEVEATTATKAAPSGMTLGSHKFPAFDGLSAAFGARLADYPRMEAVPKQFQEHSGPYQNVVSSLFFRGGKLSDYGLDFKPSIDRSAAMTALRALLGSFDPKHEHKTAVVAWALSEWCDGTPTTA